MPFMLLYDLLVILIMILLAANICIPLFIPRYKMFWMFRKNKYIEAIKIAEEKDIKNRIKEIKKGE